MRIRTHLLPFSAVAHHENAVVEVGAGALVVVVHAGLVEVECGQVSVNSHGDGANGGGGVL